MSDKVPANGVALLSDSDLFVLGAENGVYVRDLPKDADSSDSQVALHAFDGSTVAVFNDREEALAAAMQNGLEAYSVH